MFFQTAILLATFLFGCGTASSVIPGALWTDTNGNIIQALGGGFLLEGGSYYWFGNDINGNVNAYRSTDLVSWEFLGIAFNAKAESLLTKEAGTNPRVERPKVIFHQGSRTYVLWFHMDSSNYGLAKLGVAISKRVQGPYKFVRSIRPLNEDSRDMTVWVDQDDPKKTGYVIYATRVNLDTTIAKLTPDYQNVAEKVVKLTGIHREAYGVFKANGLYYLVTSGATGWDPNPNTYMTSRSMAGPWSAQNQLAPSSRDTFKSQTVYIIPVGGGKYVYAGDRYNKNNLGDSRYVWLPIKFDANSKIHIDWMDSWWLDVKSGNSGPTYLKQIKAGPATATLIGGAKAQKCTACQGGASVGSVGRDGRIRFNGIAVGKPGTYTVLVSYSNGDNGDRKASVNINGKFWKTVAFPSTGGGNSLKQIVFNVQLQSGNRNTIEFYNDGGWAPDFDYIMVQQ